MLCISFSFQDEVRIDTEAKSDIQSETCDYTACNGMTSKLNLYDTIQTFGQCQYPVGREGATDDFFCFVNADSACGDKVGNLTQRAEENLNKISNNINKTYTGLTSMLQGFHKCIA